MRVVLQCLGIDNVTALYGHRGRTDGWTDGQTDGQTQSLITIVSQPFRSSTNNQEIYNQYHKSSAVRKYAS